MQRGTTISRPFDNPHIDTMQSGLRRFRQNAVQGLCLGRAPESAELHNVNRA